MTVFYGILAFLFAALAVFMMLLILLQKGRGGGLSSAFGGAGGNTAFGTKTGDVFTWATAIVFGLFLLLSMGLIWTQSSITTAANANPTNTADAIDGELTPGESDDGSDSAPATGNSSEDDVLPEVSGDPAEASQGEGEATTPTESDSGDGSANESDQQ